MRFFSKRRIKKIKSFLFLILIRYLASPPILKVVKGAKFTFVSTFLSINLSYQFIEKEKSHFVLQSDFRSFYYF